MKYNKVAFFIQNLVLYKSFIFLSIIVFIMSISIMPACQQASLRKNLLTPNDSCEIIDLRTNYDTLKITSTHSFLFYPFGQFGTFSQLEQKMKHLSFKREISDSISLEIGTIGKSRITFLLEDERNSIEIVEGIVFDDQCRFNNNIRVGMKKIELLNLFFKDINQASIDSIRVIELKSGLYGIWHYYNTENNEIKSIIFKSDYEIKNHH